MDATLGRVATLMVMIVFVGLAGCGGGGGGGVSSTAPSSVTTTCPDGTSSTAATLSAANAACPATTLSVSPVNGSSSASPDAFAGVVVTSSGTLDTGSITLLDVTLQSGSTPLPASLSVAKDGKSFVLVPAGKLNYGQQYSFSATVNDTLGRSITATSTFTTASVQCVAPQVPSTDGQSCEAPCAPPTTRATLTSVGDVCVYPMGVKVSGANQLPSGCNSASQSCWQASIANGTVKLVATSAVGANKRPVLFAYFQNTTAIFSVSGLWNTIPIYADDGSLVGPDIAGGSAQLIDWVDGMSGGIISHVPPASCVMTDITGSSTPVSPCPVL